MRLKTCACCSLALCLLTHRLSYYHSPLLFLFWFFFSVLDPDMLPKFQVDRGGIKFVFNGANIMAPGLTSPGGRLAEGIEEGTIVAIHAEGKTHALAIGRTLKSTDDIRKENKGIVVNVLHVLGDGLWQHATFDN